MEGNLTNLQHGHCSEANKITIIYFIGRDKITPGNRENSIIISIRECLQICSGIIRWW